MSIFQKIFGKNSSLPFQVGDKVRDTWGSILVVTAIDPKAEHGLGIIRTRNAAGQEYTTALKTHNFNLVDKEAPVSSPSFAIKRVRPGELTASAYLRSDMILLIGQCPTNQGTFICEPYRSYDTSISDLELGTELLRILRDASGTPVPADLKIEQEKIFKAGKVRSWSKLCENSLNCGITQTAKQISFLPTRREGRTFHHLPHLTMQIDGTSSPEEIAKALRSCFQSCT